MGKPSGFLEYPRELPLDRPVQERIRDWNEFHAHHPEEKIRAQGARCMECGTPFCHTGLTLAGAASGCPLYNLIPEWNDLVYKGLWQKALRITSYNVCYTKLLRLTESNHPDFFGKNYVITSYSIHYTKLYDI